MYDFKDGAGSNFGSGQRQSPYGNYSYEAGMGNSYESTYQSTGSVYTSVPVPPQNNKKQLLVIFAVIAAVVCAFAAVALVYLNKPQIKLARAFAKTAEDGGYLAEDAKSKLKVTDTMTLKINLASKELGGSESRSDIEMAFDGKVKQVSGKLNIPRVGGFDFVARLNAEDLRFKAPGMDNHVFVYRYRGTNTGDLAKALGTEGLKDFNSDIEKMYNSRLAADNEDTEVTKAFKELYSNAVFNKAAPKEFEVDGSNRTCSGYELVFSKANMQAFMKVVKEYYFGTDSDAVSDIAPDWYVEYEKIMDQVIENVDETHVFVYLYQNKIAAVEMPYTDSENMETDGNIQVFLKGGDYRLQNMSVVVNQGEEETELISITGSRSSQKENFILNFLGAEMCTGFYDHESQKYEMEIKEGEYDYSVYGSFRTSRDENAFLMKITDNNSDTIYDIKAYMYKGAAIDDMSGNEFDIGNASVHDIIKLDLIKNLGKYLD